MATIKDVAQLAGVSTTTVSHVVNKTRFVAESTQLKVNAAIKQLNYSPNAVARGLRSNSTSTIGMLVTQSTNPFFAEVVDGVESYCYRQGYTLILCNTGGHHAKQLDYLRMLAEKRVDGILIMCSDIDEELESMLRSYQEIPTVIMDWGAEACNQVDRIIDNSELGGFLATEYLIKQGHQHICCVSGPLEKNICRERIQGYQRALSDHGISYRPDYILEGNFECDTAVQLAKQMMQLQPQPTAIFCLNDVMALGVMCYLQQQGIKIPEDISVVGYDNIDLSGYFSPPLTTIHQPKRRMGKTAVELLFERISTQTHQKKGFEMYPQLVVRESVKKIS